MTTTGSFYGYYESATAPLGDYPAFQYKRRDHSQSELLADVEALSAYFSQRLGLKKGDVFTLFLPTVVEGILLFLALNRLGVVVNFVHPQTPVRALEDIFDETKSRGVAIHESIAPDYAEVFRARKLPVICCTIGTYAEAGKPSTPRDERALAPYAGLTSAFYGEIVRTRGNAPAVEVVPEDVALYLQGGGTTGASRTIMLTNGNLISFCEIYRQSLGLTAHPGADTSINCMPLFHSFGLLGASLMTMCRGLRMIYMPRFDANEFVQLMKLNRVTVIRGVPNMFTKLLASPEWDGPHLANLVSLVSGGDSLSPALRQRIDDSLSRNHSQVRLAQGYGLTECCGAVMNNPANGPQDDTIGRAFPCNRIEIWGPDHRPLPDGQVGEIVVSGPTVMKGYLTADRKADVGVYRDAAGVRWMLTGDLGYRKNGYFYFSGRRKRLIIISGHNVYPLDIEKAVRRLPFVQESCAVQGFDDQGKILIRLFVACAEGAAASEEAMRRQIDEACRQRLNRFSLPRDIRFVRELPHTRVGKVDFVKLTQLSVNG